MFDAHNTEAGRELCDHTSEGTDRFAQPDKSEAATDREDGRTDRPRAICIGFAIFRI